MATIRPATPSDAPDLRTVCALAYRDNPLMRWVLPDDATRADACAAWLGPSIDRYVAAGRVDVLTVDDEPVALAAWRLPGAHGTPGTTTHAVTPQPTGARVAATLPRPTGVLQALVGAQRAAQVLGALARASDLAPAAPGPYLHYLAVHPDHQGRGLGGRLLRHGLEATGPSGGTAWLGTTDRRNLPFYRRHGLVTAGVVALGTSGPDLTVLHAPS